MKPSPLIQLEQAGKIRTTPPAALALVGEDSCQMDLEEATTKTQSWNKPRPMTAFKEIYDSVD